MNDYGMPIFCAPEKEEIDKDLDEFGPKEEKVKEVKKDPYNESIIKIKKSVSPATREAIDDCECFVRLWYDEDEYCDELECDLRPLCESSYNKINDGKEEEEEEIKIESSVTKKKVIAKPYVNRGKPSDFFANLLWEEMGKPPAIDKYDYLKQTTYEDRWKAQQAFIYEFGDHLQIIRRSTYHVYFYDGMHLMRIWVNKLKGCWIDLHRDIVKGIHKYKFKTNKVPVIDRDHVYKKFCTRIYVNSQKTVNTFVEHVLQNLHKVKLK
jgi:hypothetical protein